MRKAEVYYQDALAGMLRETDEGEYIFRYDEKYIQDYPKQFLTFTMPAGPTPYIDKRLPSFFEGLIPEGWLLDIHDNSCERYCN